MGMQPAERLDELRASLAELDETRPLSPRHPLRQMRLITEMVLCWVLEDHAGKPCEGMQISSLEQQLNKHKVLPADVKTQVELLKRMGNLASHHRSEARRLTKRHVVSSQAALDILLHWFEHDHMGLPEPKATSDCPPRSTPRVPAPAPTPGAAPMRLSLFDEVELDLGGLSPRRLQFAQAAARAFRDCGNAVAEDRGGYILTDLERRTLGEDNLISLSKWCYSGGSYRKGVEPARELSRQLFGGRVLPRLIDTHRKPLPRSEIRTHLQAFLAGESPPAAAPAAEPPSVPAPQPTAQPAPEPTTRAKGSLHCLRQAIDTMPEALAEGIIRLSPSLKAHGARGLDWLSPLAAQGYREHRDDFLRVLGLRKHEPALRHFWPRMGPQWDGLARVKGKAPGVVLVEAKAHTAELNSKCGAKDPESLRLITSALERAQDALGVRPEGPGPKAWMERYYQLANRLAFLRFMNEDLGIETWLVLMLFVDDRSHQPTSLEAWQRHITQVYAQMDLGDTALLQRVVLCPVEAPL
jgi:hypothetical protein